MRINQYDEYYNEYESRIKTIGEELVAFETQNKNLKIANKQMEKCLVEMKNNVMNNMEIISNQEKAIAELSVFRDKYFEIVDDSKKNSINNMEIISQQEKAIAELSVFRDKYFEIVDDSKKNSINNMEIISQQENAIAELSVFREKYYEVINESKKNESFLKSSCDNIIVDIRQECEDEIQKIKNFGNQQINEVNKFNIVITKE